MNFSIVIDLPEKIRLNIFSKAQMKTGTEIFRNKNYNYFLKLIIEKKNSKLFFFV